MFFFGKRRVFFVSFFLFFLYAFAICVCCCAYASLPSFEGIMFSARNTAEGQEGELFVVKNNEVFVRTIKNNVFDYSVPEDGTYNLDCGAIVAVENGKIINLGGKYYTVANENMITKSRYKDEFYSEASLECDLQKFDIINRLFVKEEQIEGFQTQLYLPDYYEVLKLILYRGVGRDNKLTTKAFVFSEKNDVGCIFYKEYQIYKPPIEKEDGKKKKKAKKKKIIAKTKDEFLQKVSTESYKKMMLEDYAYLQLFLNGDINRIVLHIEDTEVRYINAMAIDFEWKKLTFDDLLEKKVVEEYDDDGKKSKKKNNNGANNKKKNARKKITRK